MLMFENINIKPYMKEIKKYYFMRVVKVKLYR